MMCENPIELGPVTVGCPNPADVKIPGVIGYKALCFACVERFRPRELRLALTTPRDILEDMGETLALDLSYQIHDERPETAIEKAS